MPPDTIPPEFLGGYRVLSKLAAGAFGTVYSAFDDDLGRKVAIKVPHGTLIGDGPQKEARILASLRHEHIVTIFHVHVLEDSRWLIVSEFIEGGNLADFLAQGVRPPDETARLIATLADALHHAHKQGLVHRDIKPANILIDVNEKPYLTDFGLAIREEDFGKGLTGAGTIPYMSPEQARNEGHRVDGRSDIFSLGIVLYEMLTGRRPFQGESKNDVLKAIVSVEPRPPRQLNENVPIELERICLKAMSKAAQDRYSTAHDMAEDLRLYLQDSVAGVPSITLLPKTHGGPNLVPKGLRSFEANDAAAFLELLPGARNREGLPEVLRFWRDRITGEDGEDPFRVGLLYGPSGCGKSSLIKAGILPRLPSNVEAIYIEAAPGLTEERLKTRLMRYDPLLSATATLPEMIASLRKKRRNHLVLIVDQFEQWLHSRSYAADDEMLLALRQCDGRTVQMLLLVRDDFWMAITRLMRELEIRIVEGETAAAVELFDERHATKVLTLLGKAHGVLADTPTAEQQAFIDDSVKALAREGKVAPVRLTLFAEMVKGRAWRPQTLKEFGGLDGLGVRFLRESFTDSAPHRQHEAAARRVLQLLLPEPGQEIKGAMRPRSDLLTASGYANRPADFDDMLRILHRELRLVAPSEPMGTEPGSTSGGKLPDDVQHYQLTHDYLVSSLRTWLTEKERETRRGRARLLLAERTAVYTSQPLTRNLPSAIEWLNIRGRVSLAHAPQPQKTMMKRADKHYAMRGATLAVITILGVVLWQADSHSRAVTQVARLAGASLEEFPRVMDELAPDHASLDPHVQRQLDTETDPKKTLKLRLVLLPRDDSQAEPLFEEAMKRDPAECRILVASLKPHAERLSKELEKETINVNGARRLRAMITAGGWRDPSASRPGWAEQVIALMLKEPFPVDEWGPALKPQRDIMFPAIVDRLDRDDLPDTQRRALIRLYLILSSGVPSVPDHFAERLRSLPPPAGTPELRCTDALRRANLIAARIVVNGQGWEHLEFKPEDPTVRSQLIERLGPCGVPVPALKSRLNDPDPRVRQAVVMAFGQVPDEDMPVTEKSAIAAAVRALATKELDGGVREATQWLLQTWGSSRLSSDNPPQDARWHPGPYGQTMIRLPSLGIAMSSREVSVKEYQNLKEDYIGNPEIADYELCPVTGLTWYQAVGWCVALSEKEGLTPWYRQSGVDKKNQPLWVTIPKAESATGYRLPTEEEYREAARAASQTPFSFGHANESLAGSYCTLMHNARRLGGSNAISAPTGIRKPNDLGFFDLVGNAREYTHETVPTKNNQFTVRLFGNGFGWSFSNRGESRDIPTLPTDDFKINGFRIVRPIQKLNSDRKEK